MDLFEKWDKALEGGLQRLVQRSLGPGAGAHFLECYEEPLMILRPKLSRPVMEEFLVIRGSS